MTRPVLLPPASAEQCWTGSLEACFELVGADGARTGARLRGGPSHYTLAIDSPVVLAGLADLAAWHHRARELAGRRHVVDVVHDGRHLLSLGAVSPSAQERRATGSPYVAIGTDPGARRALCSPPPGDDIWVTREEVAELVSGCARRTRRLSRSLSAVEHHGVAWVLLGDVQRLMGMMGG